MMAAHEQTYSDIHHAARQLQTPVIGDVFAQLADQAREENWTHEEYLAGVLERQVGVRSANSVKARTTAARFPTIKTLEDFDHSAISPKARDMVAHLATGVFVTRADNVIWLGPPGVGKTHLAIALGHIVCAQGSRVIFDSAAGWVNQLADAHSQGRLNAELKRLDRYRLLIVDELGYLPLTAEAAALFFQLIAHRYEKSAIMITSNLAFSRWGETLGDEAVATATIDRLVHHAHVITIDAESYRTRHHRKANTNKQDK